MREGYPVIADSSCAPMVSFSFAQLQTGGHVKSMMQILFVVLVSLASTNTFAQKVKAGHDKSVDFSKFKSYSWSEPAMPPTRPVLFEAVLARVDVELKERGLAKVPEDGDLILTPSGGVDFGFAREGGTPYSPTYGGPPPSLNATMWTGSGGASTAGTYVTEGTLVLTFVERATNRVVWSGSVKQKLDLQQKNKSLELADKALIKLMQKFPGNK
jgi:hypothetical protein